MKYFNLRSSYAVCQNVNLVSAFNWKYDNTILNNLTLFVL